MKTTRLLIWVSLFAIAFAFVETSVVVYLRALYYPEGFTLPLRPIASHLILQELGREAATIIMLVAVGAMAGKTRWSRFAYFTIAFGVWDIFYYIWLKVSLDWPVSIWDWDILFLIPVPWLGPVIAPVVVSLMLIAGGVLILRQEDRGEPFTAGLYAWIMAAIGSAIVLYSFITDFAATMHSQPPAPYRYDLFAIGILCYASSMFLAFRKPGARAEGETTTRLSTGR
jgi:hypothetical protein